MKKNILILFLPLFTFSQSGNYTYYQDIEPIILNNCASCHQQGGVAPFSLTTYSEVSAFSWILPDVISNKEMPPWPPDTSYQRFAHERTLTQDEINKITDWVWSGTPQGTPTNIDCVPTKSSSVFSELPDLVIQMPNYSSTATSQSDDYVCISIPTNFPVDKKIKAIEVIPGNKEILHHLILSVDDNNISSTIITPDCMGTPAGMIGGWAPGSSASIFPKDNLNSFGTILPAGGTVYFNLHYPEGSYGLIDSSKVAFYFYDDNEQNFRELTTQLIIYANDFVIPPNQIQSMSAQYGPFSSDISLLSIFPHMHLIGKSIKSYAVTSQNDTIKLIDIPKWDFEWQDFYRFKNFIKIPAGSVLYLEGSHDNTSSNINNPNNPPAWIFEGENTSNEMFCLFVQYSNYQNGDENIDINDDFLNITGEITYANLLQTPFPQTDIVLFDNNNVVIQSATNSINGKYQFSNITNGNYNIIPASTQIPYGGVNATDALVIQNHTIGLSPLHDIYLTSADVNINQSVNSTDALLVRQRFVGLINSFHSGTQIENDFIFSNDPVNVLNYNNCETFQALALGDVNASLIPQVNKVSTVHLENVGIETSSVIPIKMSTYLELGAISLVINSLDDNIRITDVDFGKSNEDYQYTIKNNQLRFAWSNPESISFNPEEVLLYITVELIDGILFKNNYLEIGYESEFASENAVVLSDVLLKYPSILLNDFIDISIVPNPTNSVADIKITNLPFSDCKIQVLDINSRIVFIQKVDDSNIIVDCSKLAKGAYFIQLINEEVVIKNKKMIVN